MINAASNGGTITIGIGIFNETLVVDKDLTLNGVSTSTTILKPGSAGGRVITVTAGHSLTLKDLKITNGQAQSSAGGGILVNDGSLKLIGVHITNNSAMYGGGIFQESDSGGVEVIDSLIQENSAEIHGGGMYIRGSAALTNTQVISNIAGNHGGGLHVDIGSTDISGGIFNGNHTGNGNGGGINVNNQLTITGTEFFENTAGDSGGALTQWNKGYSVSITGASFENNSCKNKGGAALINSSLNLTNSTLTGNMADSGGFGNTYGGGIYTSSPAIVSSSIFTDNQAKCTGCAINGGGGLWVDRPPADLSVSTVNDSTFDGNKGWFGGGLSTSYGTLDISRTVFTNNSGGYGGGIYAYVTNGDHLLFKNNTATNKGGGLSAYSAVISNSRFMTNSAGGGGGVSAENGNLSIINVLLAENSASFLGGGAILIKNLPATISHTTIARPARGSGSGIKIEDGASLTLKNSITTNYATGLEVSAGSLTENYNLFFDNGSNFSTLNGGTITSGGNSLSGLSPLLVVPEQTWALL
ncbi:MAG: hypothetical protein HGB26_05890 [Desulfobulbaceae bacterium]|nr:hypothetical protein [Desulfobulbaceae bacterium]